MFKEKGSSKFVFFYLVIMYVFAFMFWWSYLLYAKTKQHYSDAINLRMIQYEIDNTESSKSFMETEEFKKLDADFYRQKVMIFTEGAVFFIVLFMGMVKIYQSFQQEIRIAKQQRNFLLSITHELKSPLASIKLMNETIKSRNLDKGKEHELLNASIEEVNRLDNLVENILLAAKIENNSYGFNKEKKNLSRIVEDSVALYTHRKGVILNTDITPNLLIVGDGVGLNSIVSNLIDNAIKYSVPSPVIDVKLKQINEKQVQLRVADNGIGIPDKEKKIIFDKFYRVGDEATRTTKGTGLGLFLVEQLVKYHNGKIHIENNNPNGSIFVVDFFDMTDS